MLVLRSVDKFCIRSIFWNEVQCNKVINSSYLNFLDQFLIIWVWSSFRQLFQETKKKNLKNPFSAWWNVSRKIVRKMVSSGPHSMVSSFGSCQVDFPHSKVSKSGVNRESSLLFLPFSFVYYFRDIEMGRRWPVNKIQIFRIFEKNIFVTSPCATCFFMSRKFEVEHNRSKSSFLNWDFVSFEKKKKSSDQHSSQNWNVSENER